LFGNYWKLKKIMDSKIYPLEFLYDGNCPICRYDVVRLHQADREGRIIFIDVTAPEFEPQAYGRTRQMLLARIHARRADGVIVEGPEVFRLALTALGYGWLVAPTRWPLLSQITDFCYSWFARHRGSLARRFGGFYSRLTPECDLTCHQGFIKEDPIGPSTDGPNRKNPESPQDTEVKSPGSRPSALKPLTERMTPSDIDQRTQQP
jgi:predicted DCC family thiol-disulfide oxidoreductase YuxK